jgi:predicted nucleic acid-binding Zn ribbon protein
VAKRTTFDHEDPPDDWEDDYGAGEDAEYDPEADWSPGDEFLPGEAAEIDCPHCGAIVTEDHQRCPKCDMFITKEDDPETRGGQGLTWIVIVAVALILTVVWASFR